MSYQLQAERTDAAVPLNLIINQNGGVTGLTAIVAIRDGATLNSWLDFNDLTFKTGGWTTRQAALAEVSVANAPGIYALSGGLDVNGITNLPAGTNVLIVEFNVSGSVLGDAIDLLLLRDTVYKVASQVDLDLALGLMHDNVVIDNQTYDTAFSPNLLLTARRRIYDTKANAQAAGASGLIATFDMAATYDTGGNLTKYEETRQGS